MSTVSVDVDTLHPFSINIAADVVAPIDYQATFPTLVSFACEHSTGQPSTDDEIVICVFGHGYILCYRFVYLFADIIPPYRYSYKKLVHLLA